MKDYWSNPFLGFLVGLLLTVVFLFLGVDRIISSSVDRKWQTEAIERDFGEFCSRTGEWAWVGECEQ